MPKPLTVWVKTNYGKFLKRWEYQTTWPVSWEICMQVIKQQLELDMEKTDLVQIGIEVCQSCVLSPCLFKFYAEYIMRNAELDEAQAGIKISRRNINNLRYAGDTTLMAESEEELKILLMNVKEESEKVGLKFNIQKTKIMASDPITSWQVDGEQWKEWQTLFFGLKNHWDEDHSYEIKRHLLLERKTLINLDSILKSFANKGPSSQSYGFSGSHAWMWELDYKESWAQKNWCFWTVVLEKTLASSLGCKEIPQVHLKGNQSWIVIGRTDVEAETPVLWPPDVKSWPIWKVLDAGKDWRQEEKGTTEDEMAGWHHQLNGREFG